MFKVGDVVRRRQNDTGFEYSNKVSKAFSGKSVIVTEIIESGSGRGIKVVCLDGSEPIPHDDNRYCSTYSEQYFELDVFLTEARRICGEKEV